MYANKRNKMQKISMIFFTKMLALQKILCALCPWNNARPRMPPILPLYIYIWGHRMIWVTLCLEPRRFCFIAKVIYIACDKLILQGLTDWVPGNMADILQTIFSIVISWLEMLCILNKISPKFVPKDPTDNDSPIALVQGMAWCRQARSHVFNQCGQIDLCRHHRVSLPYVTVS